MTANLQREESYQQKIALNPNRKKFMSTLDFETGTSI